jgi:hypothetical protein
MDYLRAVIAATLLVALLSCSTDKPGAVVYEYLRKTSGARTRDCGYVHLGENATEANQCVEDAYRNRLPFIVRYQAKSLDSNLVVGLAGDVAGRIVSAKYDSEGWTHPNNDNSSLVENNHLLLTPCPSPIQFHLSQSGYLACRD